MKISIKHKNRKTGRAQDDYGDEKVNSWEFAPEIVIPEQEELKDEADVVE